MTTIVATNTSAAQKYENETARKEAGYNAAFSEAERFITNRCDGPVTEFVMIHRAIELARRGKTLEPGEFRYCADPIADALHDALNERGFLKAGEVESSREEPSYDDDGRAYDDEYFAEDGDEYDSDASYVD